LTNKDIGIPTRTTILDKDILRKSNNFNIMMTSKCYDLIDLLLEDIHVNLGTEASSQRGVPPICWTVYLLCTLFRGPEVNNKFSDTNIDYFMKFLEKPRVGVRDELGDPLSIIFANTTVLTLMCTDVSKSSFERSVIREEYTRPALRILNNIMRQSKVCKFVFESEFCIDNTITALNYLADTIAGKDDIGLDPNSAMEGLIFNLIAHLDLHATSYSPTMSKRVKQGFKRLFTNKERKFLYEQVAIPAAQQDISKYDKP